MSDQSDEGRMPTAGQLRRRLAELGDPWTVDPRLEDDDPLPAYGRGGEPPEEAGAERAQGDLTDELRGTPPSNPLVRRRWMELGLLEEE